VSDPRSPDVNKPLGPAQGSGLLWWLAVGCALVAGYAVLLMGGIYLGKLVTHFAEIELQTIAVPTLRMIVVITALLFMFASAMPFVPGLEIGLGMLVLLGGSYAPLVYLCMLCALSIAFALGRSVPMPVLARAFGRMRMRRAQDLALQLDGLGTEERLELIYARSPKPLVPLLIKYRYLALILLLNLPGNSLIGGGGGIAMIAGLSGTFRWGPFLLAVGVAILPIPLGFFVMG
jgi:hypothetical protein